MAVATAGPAAAVGLAQAVVLFAVGYLLAAVVGRRRATWPLAVSAVVALALLRLQHVIDPAIALLVAAGGLAVWAACRGRMWPPTMVTVETAGVIAFASVGLAATTVDPNVGRYILAGGWAAHALWDLAHHRADTVVSRSFAEWCGVFDLLGAAAILTFPLT